MTVRANTLQAKPAYTLHRKITGSPIVADDTDLEALYELPGNSRAALNCAGWKSVRVLVRLTGGTTINLQPLEVVAGEGAFPGATDPDRGFVESQAAVTLLADGDFTDVTVNGGLLYLRLAVVAAGGTALRLFVAGHERAISRTGQE
jgi:hypothetical protein